MAYVQATVNLSNPSVVSPDPIPVNRGVDSGIKWRMTDTDLVFTYVTFGTHADNFSKMVIKENPAGQSTLRIDDSVANQNVTIKYTLYYINKNAPATVLTIDPTIRNQ